MIRLNNSTGMEVRAIPYGGIITSIRVPDRSGHVDDVVLGYDTIDAYVKNNSPYMGAIIGRYGNRIAKGMFTLDGQVYKLATNDGSNHLHGGMKGFDKVVWQPEEFKTSDGSGVIFRYTSADGEEGYPGKLTVRVTYTLTGRNELIVDYFATSDKATPVNLTQHTYFNLTGGTRDVLDHVVTIDADRFTPTDAGAIPTGVLQPVDGTPFDFRQPTPIGARINMDDEQLRNGKGYDHNYVVNRSGDGLVHAAHVLEPVTGRVLDVSTTEPGVQFYSGNNLDGSITGKSGHVYTKRFGFCLETQHFPDSPNEPEFPSTVLRPGTEYRSRTVFAFSVDGSAH
ncbi:MAG TPA: aldose epimerase family protein [Terriglobia bacterium]|jgi:aldose 1-epimerase